MQRMQIGGQRKWTGKDMEGILFVRLLVFFVFFFFVFFSLEAYCIQLLITNECFKEGLARFRFFVTVIEIQRMNTLFS